MHRSVYETYFAVDNVREHFLGKDDIVKLQEKLRKKISLNIKSPKIIVEKAENNIYNVILDFKRNGISKRTWTKVEINKSMNDSEIFEICYKQLLTKLL